MHRYPPSGYEQLHLHPHLFPEQPRVSPNNYSPAPAVGFPPAQALKVPQLEQFPAFPQSSQQQQQHYATSALQQALLSPTPPDYSRHQQVPHILRGLLSPRHSLTGHADLRLPQAELMKRRQQQQQEVQELMRHVSQGEAGHLAAHLPQKLSERQSLPLPYQNTDTYHHQHHHASPQHLLKVRAHECIPQAPPSVPAHGYPPPPSLVHSESMEEEEEEAVDCVCEGDRDAFPGHKTKGCHEPSLLLGIGGPGDPESMLGTAEHEQALGAHLYGHHPAAAFNRNKVPYRGKARCGRRW